MSDTNDTLRMMLQSILDQAVASSEECGCQLAVMQNGRVLMNLCAGFRDKERRERVDAATLFPIFSSGKSLMATAIHRLVEKGAFAYDDRVADYWPEFGCNGKESVRIWHLLSHRAALSDLPESSEEELADWPLMVKRMEQMRPAFEVGTKCSYHGVTYAWLLGEVAHRADGRDFATILKEEVLMPAKMNDTFFGLIPADEKRFAWIDDSDFPGETIWHVQMMHHPAIRRGFIPSFNGVTTALDLARHYDMLLQGKLLRAETIEQATGLCRAKDDPIPPEGTWAKFGLGYALGGPPDDYGRIFGQGGAAGAEGFADKKSGLAVGFVKNKPVHSHPDHPVRNRISEVLNLPRRIW